MFSLTINVSCSFCIYIVYLTFSTIIIMGSHTLEILRQGLWASLTGGWFYDPRQDRFCNTFHLYLWLFLLCFPFTLYLCLPPSLLIWTIYCCVIAVLFIIIKTVNYRLHYLFDTSECIEEISEETSKSEDDDENSRSSQSKKNRTEPESIEMAILNCKHTGGTPPVDCCSHNSFTEGHCRKELAAADSMEYINKLVRDDITSKARSSTIDLKVDVHRNNSSGSSEDTSMKPVIEAMRRLSWKDSTESLKPGDSQSIPPLAILDESMVTEGPKISTSELDVNVHQSFHTSASKLINEGATHSNTESQTDITGASATVSLDRVPYSLISVISDFQRQSGTTCFQFDKTPSWLGRLKRRDKKVVRRTHSALETRTCVRTLSQPGLELRGHYSLNHALATVVSDTVCATVHDNLVYTLKYMDSGESGNASSKVFKPCEDISKSSQCRTYLSRHESIDSPQREDSSDVGFHEMRPRTVFTSSRSSDKLFANYFPERVTSYPIVESQSEDKKQHKKKTSSENSFESALTGSDTAGSYHTSQVSRNSSASENPDHPVSISHLNATVPCSLSVNTSPVTFSAEVDKEKSESSLTLTEKNVAKLANRVSNAGLPALLIVEDKQFRGSLAGLDWLFGSQDRESLTSESRTDTPDSSSLSTTTDGDAESELAQRLLSESSSSPSPDDGTYEDRWKKQGAIPKRRNQSQQPQQSIPQVPPPSDPPPVVTTSVAVDNEDRADLSMRLLQMLDKTDPQECERLFRQLKRELDMKRKMGSEAEKETDKETKKSPVEANSPKRPKLTARRRRHLAGKNPHNSEFSTNLLNPGTSEEARQSDSVVSVNRINRNSPKRISGQDGSHIIFSQPASSIHIAASHDDTSEGAVHYFQDEHGNWLSYTFDGNSSGVATGMELHISSKRLDRKWDSTSLSSSSSDSTVILDQPSVLRPIKTPADITVELGLPSLLIPRSSRNPMHLFAESFLDRTRVSTEVSPPLATSSHTDTDCSLSNKSKFLEDKQKPRHYYKYWLLPCKYIKVRFDRLALLTLLDRNTTFLDNVFTILLSVGVGVLGVLLLSAGFFQDFWIFLFCVVIASCQYSLLKSVQPDASSPTHGYNRIVAFSRPVYFCVCCALTLAVDYGGRLTTRTTLSLYGISISWQPVLIFTRDILTSFILAFPLIFTFGWLPQINTFAVYFLEQIDVHVFGGNATISLLSVVFSVFRSLLAVAVLYGFCYGALREPQSSQHVIFSIFCGLVVALSYHLSRSASDPSVLWAIIKAHVWPEEENLISDSGPSELVDPLPEKLRNTVYARIKSDLIVCTFIIVVAFAIHVSTVFTALQPVLSQVLYVIAGCLGVFLHYLIPQLRKQLPWLCFSHPILKNHEFRLFEVREAAKVMWFEKMYVWMQFIERNIIYPLVFLSALTYDSPKIIKEFDTFGGSALIVVCSMKCLRCSFSDTPRQHLVLIFTFFFFSYDFRNSHGFLIDYFFMSIIFSKCYDFLLKVRFIITYIAPWQITWGSAFHAFAQPFSVPHSAMLFAQAAVSAIFSTPLNPVLGSAIFITSYVRPVKFWERDYNTKRVDHSNTRLSTHLERNPGADDNNLNSIFYEHLTRSLQHSLCGDLNLGRWGSVASGDCFVLASDYLNCLVHIIEMGNGLVTFQMRGLEFRGTYCQQREVEAITEGVEEDDGWCCFEPGHLPHMLSMNAAFNQRWLAWEVTTTKYVLEGYSISDNSAASMLQVFDLRKVLITYYVKSIIYYLVRSPKLEEWLANSVIHEALSRTLDKNYADLDPIFNMNIDEDYDHRASGISRNNFCNVYLDWIQYCISRREKSVDSSKDSDLVSLCFGLSLLGRRALGAASHNSFSSVDFFLYGLHALFKGDFRITCVRDEWVFSDMELLRRVVAPGVRMSLKLHQDHFTSPDEYDDPQVLYNAISSHEQNMVISHEGDPVWRHAVLSNTPSLLALRHVFDDGSDEYKIIMLNKRYLSFRVIKVNRECVRGLWSGQQQELVFLRNRNPERGSIQNAKQALRNIINSSCDQPIGYPIYVSPLTTSYADTHDQLRGIIGGPISLTGIKKSIINLWRRLRERCGAGCSSGGSVQDDGGFGLESIHTVASSGHGGSVMHSMNQNRSASQSVDNGRGNRGSLISTNSSVGKPGSSTLVSLAGLLSDSNNKEAVSQRVRIIDPSQVYDNINLGRRIDVQWPDENMRQKGGKNAWKDWTPQKDMEGTVVHRWMPCHRDPLKRSHVDRTILLVKIDDKYVPIAESGTQDLGAEV